MGHHILHCYESFAIVLANIWGEQASPPLKVIDLVRDVGPSIRKAARVLRAGRALALAPHLPMLSAVARHAPAPHDLEWAKNHVAAVTINIQKN